MSTIFAVMIKDVISKDLALRDTAQILFQKLEQQDKKDVTIDFADIRSISRSFAHEYLLQKEKSTKKITEVNIPQNIQKMFDIVNKTSTKPRLLEYSQASIMSLKSLQRN